MPDQKRPNVLHANPYSGEHRVRQDLLAALDEHEYELHTYSIVDKAGVRTVTLKATKDLAATQTRLNFNHDPDSHPDQV